MTDRELLEIRSQTSILEQKLKQQNANTAILEIERNTLNQALRIMASRGKIDPSKEASIENGVNRAIAEGQ